MNKILYSVVFSVGSLFLAQGQMAESDKIGGMTLVAPPNPFEQDPMPALKEVNVSWVAVVPYSFTPQDAPQVIFGVDRQWWGESPEGAEETIRLARKSNLKVMLKPQVWCHGSWIGDLDYEHHGDWHEWESDYRNYILTYAHIAEKMEVELLCIGTEVRNSVDKRTAFWRKLIKEVREIYSGKLTYCANWDDYEDISFWKDLDYIGISAYFPLSDAEKPGIRELDKAWAPIKKKLKAASLKHGKQILFAEYGYLSVEGCTGKTWELEKIRHELTTSESSQSEAIESLLSNFCDESFWAGGFLWKWYPYHSKRQRHRNNDYTPQGKLAEETIKKWYGDF